MPCYQVMRFEMVNLKIDIKLSLGKEMVDYIADYLENIRDRRVFPDVKPGYMRALVPEAAPMDGENWENIFQDVERVIMPGVSKYFLFQHSK